jgi:hypothetical protein
MRLIVKSKFLSNAQNNENFLFVYIQFNYNTHIMESKNVQYPISSIQEMFLGQSTIVGHYERYCNTDIGAILCKTPCANSF